MPALWITALLFVGCDPDSDQDTAAQAEVDDTAPASDDTGERVGMNDTSGGDTAGGDTSSDSEEGDTGDTSSAETAPQSLVAMVALPAGAFTMGSPEGEVEREQDEAQFEVTLSRGFELGAYEVTQSQFESLMGYNPSHFTDCGGDCPAEEVSWDEAAAFTNALSELAGLASCYTCDGEGDALSCEAPADPYTCEGYRLPTEAEWEYAARAGEGYVFAGSDDIDAVAWWQENSGDAPHPVGGKAPNAWGLYDMSGNVYEWCNDWYGDYPTGPVVDPVGADTGPGRVDRSGGWSSVDRFSRVANRVRYDTTHIDFISGFRGLRVARTLD